MGLAVAVTGASGRLGQVVLEKLASRPSVDRLVAIDVREPFCLPDRALFWRCDIRDADLGAALEGCDAVVHLAFVVEKGSRDPERVQSINVGGTQNLFGAAAGRGIRRVVYASSVAAYGAQPRNLEGPLTEETPLRGEEDFYYARTKAEVERWLDRFEEEHPEVAVARLRPCIFVVPRAREGRLLSGRLVPFVRGIGDQPTHLAHVSDVADAFVAALEQGARGAYNVASEDPLPPRLWPRLMGGRALPIPRSALSMLDLAYRARAIDVDPAWLRFGMRYPFVVSTEKIRRELGWSPRYRTTAEVLRALAGASTMAASRPTRLLLGTLAGVTRLRGSLPADTDAAEASRGVEGTLNLILGGDHPSSWSFWFRDGRAGVGRGLDPTARASVVIEEEDFSRLVAGELDYTTAAMTGRVRLRGDGDFGLIAGAIFEQLRRAVQDEPGSPWPRRALAWLYRRTRGS